MLVTFDQTEHVFIVFVPTYRVGVDDIERLPQVVGKEIEKLSQSSTPLHKVRGNVFSVISVSKTVF